MSNQVDLSVQRKLAQHNLEELSRNTYPGRGIIAGMDSSGKFLVQVYWIMGRSDNSRNRVFKFDASGRLFTEPADVTKMEDPSLVIYDAMIESGAYFIVSNGDQTNTVASSPIVSLNVSLGSREYEPDAPNYTQRITAKSFAGGKNSYTEMSILRRSLFAKDCDRFSYEYTPRPGFGYCITTYAGDGNPLPPFRGDPLLMPLYGKLDEIADVYWNMLNHDNRVSLAAKLIELRGCISFMHIINKYEQVG